jgi:hypothetical protein
MASFSLSLVGNAIGGPIGGAIGSVVGGLIDNVLFPVPKPPPPPITSSTFGQPIPRAWGPQVPLPGMMIWTSGWRNANSGGNKGLQIAIGKAAGKGGGPPQQVCDACFCFGRGPWATSWLRKLYANGNLIFDADRSQTGDPTPDAYGAVTWPHDGGTHKDFDTLTVYPGNGIAIPDPTIEAALGVGQTPAYRGHPNIVIRSLQGTPFGNAVPTLRAICRVDLSVTLQQIVDDICDDCGVDSKAMVSSGRLTQTVDGYAITGQSDGVSAIQPLALVYNFDAAEAAGDLRFQPRGDPGLVLIEYAMLAAHPYGDAQPDAFAWPRETQGKLPRMASITFNDPAMDLNQNTQYAIRETGSSNSNISTAVAITMTADVARRVADRILWEPWMARQGFEQGATTDRLFFLEAGRNYYIETPSPVGAELVRLTHKDRGVNGVTAFQGKRDASAIYVSAAPGADANALANALGLGGPVNPPYFIEPPSSFPGLTSNQATLFIALSGGDGTTANPAWGGCDVYRATSDVTADYDYIGTQIGVSCMGKLTAAMADWSHANPDTSNTLKVTTLQSGGEPLPSSALDAAVAQIPYFVGGEYMTAEVVTAEGDDVFWLTQLWRGLYGSANEAHSAGEPFVRVDQSVFKTALPAGYVTGSPLYFRFVSAGESLASVTTYAYTAGGTGYGGGANGVPSAPTGGAAITAGP